MLVLMYYKMEVLHIVHFRKCIYIDCVCTRSLTVFSMSLSIKRVKALLYYLINEYR